MKVSHGVHGRACKRCASDRIVAGLATDWVIPTEAVAREREILEVGKPGPDEGRESEKERHIHGVVSAGVSGDLGVIHSNRSLSWKTSASVLYLEDKTVEAHY